MAANPPSPPRSARSANASTTVDLEDLDPAEEIEPVLGPRKEDLRTMNPLQRWGEVVKLMVDPQLEEIKGMESRLRKEGKSIRGAFDEAKQYSIDNGLSSEQVPADNALNLAARWGGVDVVDYLIDVLGLRFDSVGHKGNTALMNAMLGSYPGPMIQSLLKRGADVNVPNIHAMTPLHIAAARDMLTMVKPLLNHGAEINAVSEFGSALQLAIQHGSKIEMVQTLLTEGADETITNNKRHTLLHLATINGSFETASDLLGRNTIDQNALSLDGTALHVAARAGDLDMVRLLIHNEADANIADKDGLVPLEVAAAYGRENCVQYLLGHTDRLDKYAADWSPEQLILRAQQEIKLEECSAAIGTKKVKEACDWDTTLLEEDTAPARGA